MVCGSLFSRVGPGGGCMLHACDAQHAGDRPPGRWQLTVAFFSTTFSVCRLAKALSAF